MSAEDSPAEARRRETFRGKINQREKRDKSEILTEQAVRRFLKSRSEKQHKSLLAVTKVVKILHI